jgi:SAM-dependent methyltransferase
MSGDWEADTSSGSVLAGDAYADDRYLVARQALYRWQQPAHDLPGRVLHHLRSQSGVVVDVGCGNGRYLDRIRAARSDLIVIGLDLSAGIVSGLGGPLIVADAAALPVATGSVSAVLALHMLYHVADIEAGARELVRVLDPAGVVIVSTNAGDDKVELDELWASAAEQSVGESPPARISLSSRFDLDTAAGFLGRYFGQVRVEEHRGVISVPEPDPVIAHLGSYRTWAAETGVPFDTTLETARRLVEQRIHDHGAFRINSRGGVLVCREPHIR